MSEEEINNRIAMHLGWSETEGGWLLSPAGETVPRITRPNWYADLNACREMWKELFPDQQERAGELFEEITSPNESLWARIKFKMVTASAPQHCEVFLRVVGKWPDDLASTQTTGGL